MTVITSNTYTGDGSTVLFPVTFPFIEVTDVDVYVDGSKLAFPTDWFFTTESTIQIYTAPVDGSEVLIQRNTSEDTLKVTFFPGSAIRARDLNDNFTQALYVVQESSTGAAEANAAADKAAQSAEDAANSAQKAADDAAALQVTADQALATAQAAEATAGAADTKSDAAISQSTSASNDAASAALKADQALSAVNDVVPFVIVANVAAIPGSPSDNDKVQVTDSTGIENFSPLTGLPGSFTGDPGIFVVLSYSTSGSTWIYDSYNANDPDDRYSGGLDALPTTGGTITGDLFVDGALVAKGGSGESGEITLNCENNSHGVKIQGPPHSAAASYTIVLPDDTGSQGQVLSTDGSGVTTWATVVTDIDLDSYPALP